MLACLLTCLRWSAFSFHSAESVFQLLTLRRSLVALHLTNLSPQLSCAPSLAPIQSHQRDVPRTETREETTLGSTGFPVGRQQVTTEQPSSMMEKAKQAVTGQSPYERASMPQQMGAGGMGTGVGTVGATGQPLEGQGRVGAGYPSATGGGQQMHQQQMQQPYSATTGTMASGEAEEPHSGGAGQWIKEKVRGSAFFSPVRRPAFACPTNPSFPF